MTVTLDLGRTQADAPTRRSLSELSLAVAKSKKIIVVTGAGISCSCGIPDFRSSDGLYALVKKQYPDVVLKGRDLFDATLFRDPTSTSVFYTFISQLKCSIDSASPSATHRFIKTLDDKKRLLRSYTQNIDGLEARVGLLGSSSQEVKMEGKGRSKIKVKAVRNVQLHGDIHRVRCTFCSAEFPCTDTHLKLFNEGVAPKCTECLERSEARVARSARPLKIGTLRPSIVLYNEIHPLGDDIGMIQTADMARKPDMMIIMGTSLKVHGLKKLVKDFAKIVRESAPSQSPNKKGKSLAGKVVFVNRTPPGGEWADVIDYHVAGDTDDWVKKVLEDWKKMRPADWEVQKTLVATVEDVSGVFKVVKEVTGTRKAEAGKRAENGENIPPDAIDATPNSPAPRSICGPSQATPLSPSKRRQAASHYCDIESSPRKKRDVAEVQQVGMPAGERGLLFADNTNTKPSGKSMVVEISKPMVKGRNTGRGDKKTRKAIGTKS